MRLDFQRGVNVGLIKRFYKSLSSFLNFSESTFLLSCIYLFLFPDLLGHIYSFAFLYSPPFMCLVQSGRRQSWLFTASCTFSNDCPLIMPPRLCSINHLHKLVSFVMQFSLWFLLNLVWLKAPSLQDRTNSSSGRRRSWLSRISYHL